MKLRGAGQARQGPHAGHAGLHGRAAEALAAAAKNPRNPGLPLQDCAVLGRRARGPVVGVLGCMAERLKDQLLERQKLVDLVAGPDAYRDLPRLLAIVQVRQAWPGALPCH